MKQQKTSTGELTLIVRGQDGGEYQIDTRRFKFDIETPPDPEDLQVCQQIRDAHMKNNYDFKRQNAIKPEKKQKSKYSEGPTKEEAERI